MKVGTIFDKSWKKTTQRVKLFYGTLKGLRKRNQEVTFKKIQVKMVK